MMKKALFTASISSFLAGFEKNDINILLEKGYLVEFATNFNNDKTQKTEIFLKSTQIKCNHINFSRSPLSKQTIIGYRQLKKLISENEYDVIHCHTPVAGILTRLASRKARKKGTKVIYTAHGFHFFKGAPLLNWLIYYPAEKISSYFTDVLITINTEDYSFAKKRLNAKKTYYIPGVGIDTKKFASVEIDKARKRESLGLTEGDIILLSVGELNENKNHQVVIKAMGNLKNPKIHYCIAGIGEWNDKLEDIAKECGVGDNLHLLGYRKDVGELLKMSDIFCFPSHREGLGLAAIEAMSVGLPLITSNVHGINDYSQNNISGYKFSVDDVDGFADGIGKLVESEQDRAKFGEHNRDFVKKFDLENVDVIMREIYGGVLE